jgi:DNA mismatch repair ATPase MutS
MGNLLQKKTKTDSDIDELKKRLNDLEKLDSNNDGIVSKEEFKDWTKKQKKDIKQFKQSIEEKTESKYQTILLDNERDLNDKKLEINELKKELDEMKKINNSLEHSIKKEGCLTESNINSVVKSDKKKIKLSEISKQKVNQFVETLLEDENINIKYFPDAVERQIYRNVFNILINLLDTLFETTSVNFLGHKLEFDLKPVEDIVEDIVEEEKLNNNKVDAYCDYEG